MISQFSQEGVVLFALAIVLVGLLFKLVFDLKRDMEEKHRLLEQRLEELEGIALELEKDLEALYSLVDKKADIDYVEKSMDLLAQEAEGKTLVELMEEMNKRAMK